MTERSPVVSHDPGIPLVACAFRSGFAAGLLCAPLSISTRQLCFRAQHSWSRKSDEISLQLQNNVAPRPLIC